MEEPTVKGETPFKSRFKDALNYLMLVIVTFIVLQPVFILMHEFTHSTVAWLLGCEPRPFSIEWGNFLTMTGWDEGVHYKKIFPEGGNMKEALIGGGPLIVHTAIVVSGLVLLHKKWMIARKWLFHVLYWFILANLMELISYVVMRSFAAGGDVGHLNRGLGLNPWIVFVIGTALIAFGLYVLFTKVMPTLWTLFAHDNALSKWAILVMSAFLLFLWGSGLRVVLYVYPDPQWMFGLIGFAAFAIVLLTCRPHLSTER